MATVNRTAPGVVSKARDAVKPNPGHAARDAALDAIESARIGDVISGAGGAIGGGSPDPGYNQMDAEGRLKSAQADLKSKQAQLKSLQAMINIYTKSGGKGRAAQLGRLKAQVTLLTSQIKDLNVRIPNLQNQYYVQTGQYEKLLTGNERNAFLATQALFKSYGLESLAGKIYDYVKNGYDGDTISLLLQDTPEYKTRFAGNEKRKQSGSPVLSAAEYLATEEAMRHVMRTSGLPQGFYDTNQDFANWIGQGVSATEIQQRVDLATQATILSNPEYKQALNRMGIDDGHMAAYFLDTKRAMPYLQKAAATAQVGAESLRAGLGFNQAYAEQLATMGIGADQARSGFGQVASEMDTLTDLAQIYGGGWNQGESEAAAFGTAGAVQAQQKRGRLLSQERGAFGGAAGGARGGLSSGGGQR